MITINYDPATGLATLAQTTTIKSGGYVPVTIVFASTPSDLTQIQLALGTDSAPPWVLAYTEAFTSENATTWTAELNTNDTRLNKFMAGKGATTVNLELACTFGAYTTVTANLSITVQLPIISGPAGSESGPTYYTEEQMNTLLAPLTPAPTQTDISVSSNVTANLFNTTNFSQLAVRILAGAGTAPWTGTYSLPVTGMATGATTEVNIEFDASANPTLSFYNSSSSGLTLATVNNPVPAAPAYWYGRFRFDGTQWHCLFRAFLI